MHPDVSQDCGWDVVRALDAPALALGRDHEYLVHPVGIRRRLLSIWSGPVVLVDLLTGGYRGSDSPP